MENEHFWSWLAGFIDGEGSIGLRRNTLPKQRFAYKHYLSLAQKDMSVLEFVKSNIGGCITTEICKGRTYYHFFLYNRQKLLEILPRVIPFMKVKRKQAELLIDYFNRCGFNDMSCYELRREYFKRFMLLNTNGNGDKGGRYKAFEERRKIMAEDDYVKPQFCLSCSAKHSRDLERA